MISAKTRYVAIVGHPVSHTLSPKMHQAAFDRLHLDYQYLQFDILPAGLKKAVAALKLLGFRGFNVTVPHKEKIIPLLDEVSSEARMIGAVNTVLIEGGKLKGFNTDGAGLIEALRQKWNFRAGNKRVTILGAGGAAKAAVTYLCLEKVKEIGIANRTREHGIALRNRLMKFFPGVRFRLFDPGSSTLHEFLDESDLLINTTSVGLRRGDSALLPLRFFHRGLKVMDLIYNPPVTPFLKSARKRGCSVSNGAGMLLCQGALAFQIWTGKPAPVKVMAKALSLR